MQEEEYWKLYNGPMVFVYIVFILSVVFICILVHTWYRNQVAPWKRLIEEVKKIEEEIGRPLYMEELWAMKEDT